jgi:menaquinone-dependent protoporphyrinogen oxidase
MTKSILVAYATRYGSTQEAAAAVTEVLCERGFNADLQLAKAVKTLEGYSVVVLGAPLFMFHWHADALHFLARHRQALQGRPLGLFALGPVQDPCNEQEWKDSRAQLEKELAQFPWLMPVALEIFGGRYDPGRLRFPLKLFAGAAPASDILDLAAVRAWGGGLVELL